MIFRDFCNKHLVDIWIRAHTFSKSNFDMKKLRFRVMYLVPTDLTISWKSSKLQKLYKYPRRGGDVHDYCPVLLCKLCGAQLLLRRYIGQYKAKRFHIHNYT
jgi:hypothetical protein